MPQTEEGLREMHKQTSDSERDHRSRWRSLRTTVVRLFVVAVLINYLWEVMPAPLYVGLASFRVIWWHCFVASLGDGLLLLGIFGAGWPWVSTRGSCTQKYRVMGSW